MEKWLNSDIKALRSIRQHRRTMSELYPTERIGICHKLCACNEL